MRAKRIIWFLIMIGIGLAGGLLYGWVIDPIKYVDTTPNSLHPNYKADYVLMVAEIYGNDHDLTAAESRLALLEGASSMQTVTEGLATATQLGYSDQDMQLMNQLALALQPSASSDTEGAQP